MSTGDMQQPQGFPFQKNTHHLDSSQCTGYDVLTSPASSQRSINRSVLGANHYCNSVLLASEKSLMT